MKCVENLKSKKIYRCSDRKAEELVESGDFKYASKMDWKLTQRKYWKK